MTLHEPAVLIRSRRWSQPATASLVVQPQTEQLPSSVRLRRRRQPVVRLPRPWWGWPDTAAATEAS